MTPLPDMSHIVCLEGKLDPRPAKAKLLSLMLDCGFPDNSLYLYEDHLIKNSFAIDFDLTTKTTFTGPEVVVQALLGLRELVSYQRSRLIISLHRPIQARCTGASLIYRVV